MLRASASLCKEKASLNKYIVAAAGPSDGISYKMVLRLCLVMAAMKRLGRNLDFGSISDPQIDAENHRKPSDEVHFRQNELFIY